MLCTQASIRIDFCGVRNPVGTSYLGLTYVCTVLTVNCFSAQRLGEWRYNTREKKASASVTRIV